MSRQPANDNAPAYAIGEAVEVMTPGKVLEIITTERGHEYLVLHTKPDGREVYIRTAEDQVFEPDTWGGPVAVQVAA